LTSARVMVPATAAAAAAWCFRPRLWRLPGGCCGNTGTGSQDPLDAAALPRRGGVCGDGTRFRGLCGDATRLRDRGVWRCRHGLLAVDPATAAAFGFATGLGTAPIGVGPPAAGFRAGFGIGFGRAFEAAATEAGVCLRAVPAGSGEDSTPRGQRCPDAGAVASDSGRPQTPGKAAWSPVLSSTAIVTNSSSHDITEGSSIRCSMREA